MNIFIHALSFLVIPVWHNCVQCQKEYSTSTHGMQELLKTEIEAVKMMYEILTGKTPWEAKNYQDLLFKIKSQSISELMTKDDLGVGSAIVDAVPVVGVDGRFYATC